MLQSMGRKESDTTERLNRTDGGTVDIQKSVNICHHTLLQNFFLVMRSFKI